MVRRESDHAGMNKRSRRDGPHQIDRQRQAANKPSRRNKRRRGGVLFLAIALFAFAALLIYQLYQIQVVAYAENAQKAANQHYRMITEQPVRGKILDRNGVELAGTTFVYRIGVTPKDVRSISHNISLQEIAEAMATSLDLPLADVNTALADKDAIYIQLKKDATKSETDALKDFRGKYNIGGIRIDSEPRRFYTNSRLASQVIGYTNYDDQNLVGQLGIELSYNEILTGQPGYTYVETDNYSKGVLPFSVPTSLRAKNGQNVVLNLDSTVQKIIQEELENAIKVYDITAGGTAIVMNPYTGAVLGMASYPTFDCQAPAAAPDGVDPTTWDASEKETIDFLSREIWRNRAISDTYEPGSTFKSITAAVALEEGLSRESELFNDSPMKVNGWTISCSTKVGHGIETFEVGFYRSCNPVFAQLSQRAGVKRFYSYVRSFGFMGPTGIDLPGEGTGILHANPTELDMVTLSYGESSTVTPIQMAASYSVFANGGNLVRPSVVKAITDEQGNVIRESSTETIRKVISENTAARVLDLMEGVVLYGTGSAAYVEGYSVAGKTSTSTDDNGDHTLSFAAIAPSDNPEIVVLVVLNKPDDKKLTSKAAAKTVGLIVNRTLEYMGIVRNYSSTDISKLSATTKVPDITGLKLSEARKLLSDKGFLFEAGDPAMSDTSTVKSQYPAAETELHKKSVIVLYPVSKPEPVQVAVPDFTGKNIHEAMQSAAASGVNILIDGECLGIVVSQDPAPTFKQPVNPLGEADGTAQPKVTGAAEPTPTPMTKDPVGETDQQPSLVIGKVDRGSVVTIRFAPVEEELPDQPGSGERN